MLTHVLRFVLGHSLKPFRFVRERGLAPDLDAPGLGVYVHIPFCASLCPFCPYQKVEWNPEEAQAFLPALLSEIRMAGRGGRKAVASVYFGGGSPALMAEDLGAIMDALKESFDLRGHAGIELHPRDVTPPLLSAIKRAGFDMVSLGVQSFDDECLVNLGRSKESSLAALRAISDAGFAAIDVDLIFGIPGQDGESLLRDFRMAADNGATQISTYPFIDFSYARNRRKPLGRLAKRRLLGALLDGAKEMGFERDTVWTFRRSGSPRYSSVTRDNYVGFGPSATSLGRYSFKINTFHLKAYREALAAGEYPSSLVLRFSPRLRALYWLFWRCYNRDISVSDYSRLFGREVERDFRGAFFIGRLLGFLKRGRGGPELTDRGSYAYHLAEQAYTRQYIDKTWRISREKAWPQEILLW